MRPGWAVALVMVVAVSCGDPESGSGATEGASGDESGTASFAFKLTVESGDGADEHVQTTEGVFDPDAGDASVVQTTASTEDRSIMVDGVTYFETPDFGSFDSGEPDAAPSESCSSVRWSSMGPAQPSGTLVDINNPTGLDIERLQEMVSAQSPELTPSPSERSGDGAAYTVELAEEDQNEYRRLQDMVVRVDGHGRVISADWSLLVDLGDPFEGTDMADPGDTSWTETMSLTLSDFGTPVEVTAPEPDDTCDLTEMSLEHACGFGATDVREAAMGEIYDGDREGLREIVESFTTETNGTCPQSLSVPLLVSAAACDPDMVRFLFEDLGMDPNQSDLSDDGHTALFSITYYDAEDDPEMSEVCTPGQDLETVRVLLDAGADPCIGPEGEHRYDPSLDAPEWDPPAIGISEWDEAPEIVALVEAAATTCSP